MSSSSKLSRPAPFTPKRPVSTSSSTSSLSSNTLLASTHKKYKAPLSAESRTRSAPARPKSVLASVPGSPTRSTDPNARSLERPRTPGTPRRGTSPNPFLMPATSTMDVSNVDPEEVLVDFQNVPLEADISGDMDEAWLRAAQLDHGKEDKVMVSIRVRPSDQQSAWDTPGNNSIQLGANHAKTASSSSSTFYFDSILTGSPNKPIYTTVGRSHVHAAMEGFNAVIFAYGQTASGKTYTLTGDDSEPGIIPRAMRDVFAFIRRTPSREYLLRCSYLEIYNETINDLLAPPGSSALGSRVEIQGGKGGDIILTPLREEVVTSLKAVKDVLKRGEAHRRTACTDWNERSSRSHSVFRMVIESRERGNPDDPVEQSSSSGRNTPGPNGRHTPGLNGRQTPGPGSSGPRLQARGGRSVQTSVLSLIDLAGSEKATSDKDRTREGKYINTSLLTLGTVIGTLAENAAKNKTDHIPFRNSKLTRMLQPSLSGNARISVICTINPDAGAIAESTSTLLFARRVKAVKLNAQKKEIVDTDALIEKYRKEIEDLKARLADKEAAATVAPIRSRRLSAREQIDESKAMKDLNSRIQQLTKLILTSQTVVDDSSESRPASPVKVDFDLSPYQLQQELLAARHQLETQATQILSLEEALSARPEPLSGSESEKDRLIAEQAKTIRELEIAASNVRLGEPLAADIEREWATKLEHEIREREEKERWAGELVKQLEKEKKVRVQLEVERRALAAFVSKFDSLGLGSMIPERRQTRPSSLSLANIAEESPIRVQLKSQPSLLEQLPEDEWGLDSMGDVSFEMDVPEIKLKPSTGKSRAASPLKDKENLPTRS